MGDPVDYIIFDGYADFRDGDGTADDIQIILLDVKSGGAFNKGAASNCSGN